MITFSILYEDIVEKAKRHAQDIKERVDEAKTKYKKIKKKLEKNAENMEKKVEEAKEKAKEALRPHSLGNLGVSAAEMIAASLEKPKEKPFRKYDKPGQIGYD